MSLIETIRATEVEVAGRLSLAIYALGQGEHEQALREAVQSRQLAQASDSRLAEAEALVSMGHARAGLGHLHAAAGDYQQAVALYETLGIAGATAEGRAGLATVALAQGEAAQALAQVELVLDTLASGVQVGLDEPFYVYLVCYHVLESVGDLRAATVLEEAQGLLKTYAATIADEARRRAFLEDVAVHRGLAQGLLFHRQPFQQPDGVRRAG